MRQLKLSLLLGLLLWVPSAYAQSVRFQSQAISTRGAGIANATVAVCTQPANTNTQPCSPLATLATSTITTSGGANPLTADSFGNFFFYAAPGRYTVQIYGPAVSGQFVTPDVDIGGGGSSATGAFGNLTVSGTGTFTGLMQCKNFEGHQCADGVTQTIPQAIAALGSNPGTVWVMPGTQSISTGISLNQGQGLICFGYNIRLGTDPTNGSPCKVNYTGTTGNAVTLLSQEGAQFIIGIEFFGNKAGGTSGHGLFASPPSGQAISPVYIKDSVFRDFVQDGCHFENNVFDVTMEHVACSNNGGVGFSLSLTAGTIAPGTFFFYNTMFDHNTGEQCTINNTGSTVGAELRWYGGFITDSVGSAVNGCSATGASVALYFNSVHLEHLGGSTSGSFINFNAVNGGVSMQNTWVVNPNAAADIGITFGGSYTGISYLGPGNVWSTSLFTTAIISAGGTGSITAFPDELAPSNITGTLANVHWVNTTKPRVTFNAANGNNNDIPIGNGDPAFLYVPCASGTCTLTGFTTASGTLYDGLKLKVLLPSNQIYQIGNLTGSAANHQIFTNTGGNVTLAGASTGWCNFTYETADNIWSLEGCHTKDTGTGAEVRATSPTLATATLTSPTVSLLTNGTGLQIFNTTTTCTTAASVGATCTTAAISLPVAEADTSYRVACTGKGPTAVPVVSSTANSSVTQFTITIAALTAVAASFASYDCVVGHN